ncbi:hypothetical protein VQ042_21770 [Aurantimonas sp. A2-1-M11]|uniref:hypothetical protein n=1 Tax=Aurantimonas sp. A2-1-M11 TaxID=3113712 RepID=UPI002F94840B
MQAEYRNFSEPGFSLGCRCATGLAAPNGDTAQDRADRRSNIVDGFAKFNPVVGPAVKRVYDNFGNETITPEKKGRAGKDAAGGAIRPRLVAIVP